MNESSSTADNTRIAQHSAQAIEQLTSAFAAYNEISNRMQQSYMQLQAEVQRLRMELRQKNEQLERKSRLAALGEMAAGMAHEIRNPLGGIQLYASLLERDLQQQPEQCSMVRKISNGVKHMDIIVNDILAFTHDQACEKAPLHLKSLVHDVLDYLRPSLTAGQVRIDLDQVPAGLYINADAYMMQRVFLNLIRNAVEAVEHDGLVQVMADQETHSAEHTVRIRLRDNGPGIKPDVLGKIFDPFFTTKDTGTGLGLAIVHRLVECHNGLITVTNNPDGGTTFTILLPQEQGIATGARPTDKRIT